MIIKPYFSNLTGLALASTLIACTPSVKNAPDLKEEESKSATIKIEYPVTVKGNVVDTYFTHDVADPYRWLEDDRSAETEAWVKAQNAVTQDYLKSIPYRDQIGEVVKKLINYERVSAPITKGDYQYFYRNDGLQNQAVVYRQKGDADPEVFIDPNKLSDDGTVSLAAMEFSEDGSLVAYQTSTGGSDWRQIFVMNTNTMELIGEPLVNVKFSQIAWRQNDGFYYSSYDKPKGSELSEKTDQHKLYFHKIGTPQSTDEKVFGHSEDEKHRYVFAETGPDGKYLFVYAMATTSGNRVFIKDLTDNGSDFVVAKASLDSDAELVTIDGDTIYIKTNHEAPNGRVVSVSTQDPALENWVDVIPETENVLSVSTVGGYLFAEYMVDAIAKVKQYTFDGKLVRVVELPGLGSVESSGRSLGGIESFTGASEDTHTFFMFENYATPKTTYQYNIETGESTVYFQPAIDFDGSQYVSTQVFYSSKDGTKVPMLITHHKDTELNGANPTLLYSYGGFNVSLPPRFSSTVAAWLELGGVYAVPNIRGGGEYGKEWHKAGTQLQKQNVFDDFIAAGEYLIDNKYTSSAKLAIRGGSNGGLLVGAVMTQRPDLAAVALPAVGVLDMLRYHTFTAGAGWAYDYGTSEQNEEMFKYLKGYSPVHNVKAGVNYPATMITTADHDDRVVPAHSFKFAATLQDKDAGKNPMLIRIESDAGHGAGTPISKTIDQYADIYGFTLFNMGVTELK